MSIRPARRKRSVILTLCLLCLASVLPAAGLKYPLEGLWSWAPGDGGVGIEGEAWTKVEGGSIAFGTEGSWFRLRSRIGPELLSGRDPRYLLLGKFTAALEVRLDGVLIGSLGAFPPRYSAHGKESTVFLLPLDDGQRSSGIDLEILGYSDGSACVIPPSFIGDGKAAAFENTVVTFLNMTLYYVLGWICVSAGLFFLMQFIARPRDRPNAFYAFASIAIGLYFMEMGSDGTILPLGLNRSLAKACLTFAVSTLILFFRSYFGLKNRRLIVGICIGEPLAVLIAFLWAAPALTRTDLVFSLALLPILISIFYMLFLVIRETRKGNREAYPLLIGVALAVACGAYDSFFKLRNREPLFWMQGFGFFALDISMFAALSVRSFRMQKDLEEYSADIVAKSGELNTLIGNIGEAARQVAHISTVIDNSVGAVSEATGQLGTDAASIGDTSDKQALTLERTSRILKGLLESQELIFQGIEKQGAGTVRAKEAVQSISSSIEEITDSARVTKDIAHNLDSGTEQGLSSARSLKLAMEKIARASTDIGPIVDAVDDFAERTDLLAMNAAIEAAHSGAAGRGFAVIAGEIKKLAAASSERASLIRASVEEITERISEGVAGEAQVSSFLKEIASRAGEAGERVSRIYASISQQRESVASLVGIMEGLEASATAIRTEADKQADGSLGIREAMDGLVECTQTMRGIIQSIGEENKSLSDSVSRLAAVSREGSSVIAGFKTLLAENDL